MFISLVSILSLVIVGSWGDSCSSGVCDGATIVVTPIERNLLLDYNYAGEADTNSPWPSHACRLANHQCLRGNASPTYPIAAIMHHVVPRPRFLDLFNYVISNDPAQYKLLMASAARNFLVDKDAFRQGIYTAVREAFLWKLANGEIVHKSSASKLTGDEYSIYNKYMQYLRRSLFVAPKNRCDDPGSNFETLSEKLFTAARFDDLQRLYDIAVLCASANGCDTKVAVDHVVAKFFNKESERYLVSANDVWTDDSSADKKWCVAEKIGSKKCYSSMCAPKNRDASYSYNVDEAIDVFSSCAAEYGSCIYHRVTRIVGSIESYDEETIRGDVEDTIHREGEEVTQES